MQPGNRTRKGFENINQYGIRKYKESVLPRNYEKFISNLILVLSLYHGGPLGAQRSHGLEDIDNALILQPLEHYTQSDEHAGASDSGTERGKTSLALKIMLEMDRGNAHTCSGQ